MFNKVLTIFASFFIDKFFKWVEGLFISFREYLNQKKRDREEKKRIKEKADAYKKDPSHDNFNNRP